MCLNNSLVNLLRPFCQWPDAKEHDAWRNDVINALLKSSLQVYVTGRSILLKRSLHLVMPFPVAKTLLIFFC